MSTEDEESSAIPGVKKSERQRRCDELLASLPDVSTREALQELSRVDPVIWTMYHRRLRGRPMTFDMGRHLTVAALQAKAVEMSKQELAMHRKMTLLYHRPFMQAPLRDDHPHKVYKKGRQTGVSELSLTESVCFLDQHPGTKWIYTFPRDTQLQDFSTTRIKEAMEETPRMRRLQGVPNQVYTKKIGESFLILRSAWESNLGEGIDAAGVTLDEKDRMKPGVDVAFRESLSSSAYGWLREVSTPTLPGRGVDASWQLSDQRYWFVKCSKCGMAQTVGLENIQQVKHVPLGCVELPPDSYEYLCVKARCRGKLDRINGEWVAKRPNIVNTRGYHMPQTIAVWISATEVMQKRIKYKFVQLWMNYVLGETSMGDSILLTDMDFDYSDAGHQFVTRRTHDWPVISVGIDWGHRNWVVVEGVNTNGRRYIINAKMFEDDNTNPLHSVRAIDAFIEPYNPDVIVADDGYGKDRNAHLLKRYGEGRFFACRYNPAEKGGRTFTPVWSKAQVLVDRTMSIKLTCKAIKDREVGLPNREIEEVKLIESHFKALAPIKEENEDGEIIEVISSSGDDHFAHCAVYAELGMDYMTHAGRFNFDFC